jgi:hypothetical protein
MALLSGAELVRQCLDPDAPAWRHFITDYLPLAGLLLDRHYPQLAPRREALLREVLLRARDEQARFLRDYRGRSEREFLLHLREMVLSVFDEAAPVAPVPETPLEWETFEAALAPLTALEKQVVWLDTLNPREPDLAVMLRLDDRSVAAARQKAQDLLRAHCDRWSADQLVQNRYRLALAVRSRATKDCAEARVFLHLLDGQLTWRDRTELERHLEQCWHCVDALCRLREAARLGRVAQPFTETEAQPYFRVLGLAPEPAPRWKRWLGAD